MSDIADLVQRLRDHALEGWSVAFATMSEAADAIEALQAERNALLADADRYRWLRDKSAPPHNFCISVPIEFEDVRYTPQEVDADIDAAMKGANT